MKLFVCIKQVPDTETKIKLLADRSGIDTSGVKWVMNPYDEFAVEEAIKFREANPGTQVFVISVGPKARVQEVLRTALAMGADEGVVVNAPENIDSLQTAKYLASAIKAEGGADLIFTGKTAIDDNANSVNQMLAHFLEVPHVNVVSKFKFSGGQIEAQRDVEGGTRELVELQAPAVIGANKGLNMPRYASLPGIMKAKKKQIKEHEASVLAPDLKTKSRFISFAMPPEKPPVKLITGEPAKQANELVQLLRDEAKIL